jgi:hypothetical protein
MDMVCMQIDSLTITNKFHVKDFSAAVCTQQWTKFQSHSYYIGSKYRGTLAWQHYNGTQVRAVLQYSNTQQIMVNTGVNQRRFTGHVPIFCTMRFY